MRIHIENLTGKQEEQDSVIAKMRQSFEEEVSSMKREKRRLDDLLTIREEEISVMKRDKEKFNAEIRAMEARYIK